MATPIAAIFVRSVDADAGTFDAWIATLGPATGTVSRGQSVEGRWWQDSADHASALNGAGRWAWGLIESVALFAPAAPRPPGLAAELWLPVDPRAVAISPGGLLALGTLGVDLVVTSH